MGTTVVAPHRLTAQPASFPSEDAVREALQHVAKHRLFIGCPRLTRFLEYIVEETLAGRTDAIKEYTLGVEVYGRPPAYDPKIDATVRVEAGRLRAKLAKYYLESEAPNSVRIQLPRGTYVPVITGDEATVEPKINTPAPSPRFAKAWSVAAAVVLLVAAAVATLPKPRTHTGGVLSIAVLPLMNTSGDAETEHYGAALRERLTSEIAREGTFRVPSRTDSDVAAQSGASLAAMGARIGAGGLLEGNMERTGKGIRLTVQLIASRNGYHVWSQTYESLPGRLSEFEEKVCYLISRTIRARYAGISDERFGQSPVNDSVARALYLKGNEAWQSQRKQAVFESVEYYHQALARDPAMAKAYEGLSASELFLASLDLEHANEHVARAKAAARKAISLDDRLDDAHARLGNIYLRREWKFVEAEAELKRAVMLSPGSSPITRWYSEAARLREFYTEAREELENALLANPNSEMIEAEFALLELQLGRPAEAELHARRALASSPNYRVAHLVLGRLHQRAGRLFEAEQELKSCSNATEFGRLCGAALGHLYGQQGRRNEALAQAAELENAPGSPLSLAALVYLGAGEKNRALDMLTRAYEQRDKFLPLIKIDDRFGPLRDDARYRSLLRRLAL